MSITTELEKDIIQADISGNISFGDYTQRGLTSRFVGVLDTTTNPLCGIEIENTTLGGNYSQKLHLRSHHFANSEGRRLTIHENGNVGIGTSDPESKLDVKGKVLISNGGTWGHTHGERTGGTTPQSIIDSSQLQLHAPNNYGNDAGFKLYMGCFGVNNRTFIQCGLTSLESSYNGALWLNPCGGGVSSNHQAVTSDDRIKINEEYITNGLEIVNKLKPQIYDKINIIDDVNNLKNIDISGQTYRESGFIVQDIYYDIPEIRHNITLPHGIIPSETREVIDDDPTIDPDYSSWGPDPTTLNYIGLMPYLANAIQELSRQNDAKTQEINELKTENAQLKADMALVKQKLGL